MHRSGLWRGLGDDGAGALLEDQLMARRPLVVVGGYALVVVGVFLIGTAIVGDLLVKGPVVNRYADPRDPQTLRPGVYPLDWIGPAKGPIPFPSDLHVVVQVRSGDAVWHPSAVAAIIPTGPSEQDLGRSPLGSIEVRQASSFRVRLNPSGPTEGRPRLRVHQTKYPRPRTRTTELTIAGVVLLGAGTMAVGWGRQAR